jgi:tetratricopeptide (TPR) repeat protein
MLVLVLLSVVLFTAYRYKQYIVFWKYNYNKLEHRINSASSHADPESKLKAIREVLGVCSEYMNDHPLEPDAYLMAGRAHFDLGEAINGKNLSQMVIQGLPRGTGQADADIEFLEAMRLIKKGIALSDGADYNTGYALMLVKAGYYTGYYSVATAGAMLKDIRPDSLGKLDDTRFYALVSILNGKADDGIRLLHRHGRVADTIEGQLFLASALVLAKQNTNAIMQYQNVLKKTTDSAVLKFVHISLGKLYYNQSLYRESLGYFTNAMNIDHNDNELKIWLGKNYSALGDKIKARALWSEVLASDSSNEEAKKLLNPM